MAIRDIPRVGTHSLPSVQGSQLPSPDQTKLSIALQFLEHARQQDFPEYNDINSCV